MSRIVYHYTSPQGALDILKDKKLRFTDCQYFNDMGEFVYIFEPLKEAYDGLSKERGEDNENFDDLLDYLFPSPYENTDFRHIPKKRFKYKGLPRFRYYVLCASKNADNANMWNYYVKDGAYQGYNLGIDSSIIASYFSELSKVTAGKIELVSGEVVYNRKKQEEQIYRKLKELVKHFDSRISELSKDEDDTPSIDEYQGALAEYINEHKLFFKNPAFESEQEYRFVLKVHNDISESNDIKFGFRAGVNGIITPYIEWCFCNLKTELLKQITISPMIEPKLAQESFRRFLAYHEYQNIEIKQSTIKLRY